MTTLYVVPSPGARIRQPERNGLIMPEAGAHVPDNDFYQRLIAGGDVSIGTAPTKAKAEPVTESAAAPPPAPKPATEPARGSRRSSASEG